MSILLGHSEEEEPSEHRAGGQMKGLLLKVSLGGCLWGGFSGSGERMGPSQIFYLPTLLGKPVLLILLPFPSC